MLRAFFLGFGLRYWYIRRKGLEELRITNYELWLTATGSSLRPPATPG